MGYTVSVLRNREAVAELLGAQEHGLTALPAPK